MAAPVRTWPIGRDIVAGLAFPATLLPLDLALLHPVCRLFRTATTAFRAVIGGRSCGAASAARPPRSAWRPWRRSLGKHVVRCTLVQRQCEKQTTAVENVLGEGGSAELQRFDALRAQVKQRRVRSRGGAPLVHLAAGRLPLHGSRCKRGC